MRSNKPTIVAPTNPKFSSEENFEIVTRLQKEREEGYFLVLPASSLWNHAEFVDKLVDQHGKPKVFMVLHDTKYDAFYDNLKKKTWKNLFDRSLPLSGWNDVIRVMNAWASNLEKETIATAIVDGDMLVVYDCSLQRLECQFSLLNSLSDVEESERSNFEIAEWGDYLYWPKYDLHVNVIDSIRYRTDSEYQKKKDIESLTKNQKYGEAIRKLRELKELSREDVEKHSDISAKTVQRIENGTAVPTIKSLEALATAHQVSFDKYLELLAEIAQAKDISPGYSKYDVNPNTFLVAEPPELFNTLVLKESWQNVHSIDSLLRGFDLIPKKNKEQLAKFVRENSSANWIIMSQNYPELLRKEEVGRNTIFFSIAPKEKPDLYYTFAFVLNEKLGFCNSVAEAQFAFDKICSLSTPAKGDNFDLDLFKMKDDDLIHSRLRTFNNLVFESICAASITGLLSKFCLVKDIKWIAEESYFQQIWNRVAGRLFECNIRALQTCTEIPSMPHIEFLKVNDVLENVHAQNKNRLIEFRKIFEQLKKKSESVLPCDLKLKRKSNIVDSNLVVVKPEINYENWEISISNKSL